MGSKLKPSLAASLCTALLPVPCKCPFLTPQFPCCLTRAWRGGKDPTYGLQKEGSESTPEPGRAGAWTQAWLTQNVGSFCPTRFRCFVSPPPGGGCDSDEVFASPPGEPWISPGPSCPVRAPPAEATCEGRMEGAHGLTAAVGTRAKAACVREVVRWGRVYWSLTRRARSPHGEDTAHRLASLGLAL